jgi:two-component system response regulator
MTDRTILLVEDNPDDELLTLRALRRHRLTNTIDVVRDGAEALDYLFGQGDFQGRDRSKQPQLILLDLKLPKVDGIEVLRSLRADPRTQLIPVVILTSSKEENDLISGYRAGVNSYIVKPVDFDQFSDSVRQLGFYWLLINEPAPFPGGGDT